MRTPTILLALLVGATLSAQTAGDYAIVRKASGVGDTKTYVTPSNSALLGTNGSGAPVFVLQSAFAASGHMHAIPDVTNLQAALDALAGAISFETSERTEADNTINASLASIAGQLATHTHVSDDIIDASEGGFGAADAAKVVLFGNQGQLLGSSSGSLSAVSGSALSNGDAIHGVSVDGTGGYFESENGQAFQATNINATEDIGHFEHAGEGLHIKNDGGLEWTSLTGQATTKTALAMTVGDITNMSADARTFNQAANFSAMRTALGVRISVDVQAHDADLDAIGALSPSNDDILQRKLGVWTNRTVAQVKTDFGLHAVATSGSASDLNSGTLPAGRMPALTGDVTTSAGSVATTIATDAVTTTKVINDAITYAKMQNVSATDKVLGRSSSGSGDVQEIPCTDAGRDLIGAATIAAQQDTLNLVPATDIMSITRFIEMLPSWGYGHSGLAPTGQGRSTNSSWAERTVKRLNMGTFTNRALASYEMQNVCIGAFGTSVAALTWTPNTKGVVYLDCGITDMFGSMSVAQKDTCFKMALRHWIWQMNAASKVADVASFTRTGTWVSPINSTLFSSGSRSHTIVNGSYCVIPFTGDSVVVTILGLDNTTWGGGGGSTYTISAESGSSPQLPINGTTSNYGKLSPNIGTQAYVPIAILIKGFGNGAHSVRVTHTGSAGNWLVMDDALIPSSTPPTIIIQKIMYCTSAYYATTSSQVSDALIDKMNAYILDIADEFTNVYVVDSNPLLNRTTMLHSDGAHKNDLGVSLQADYTVSKILTNLTWRNGQNALAVP